MKIVGESFAGVGTAATRVAELYVPSEKRLFDDPLALILLPFWWRVLFRFFFLPGLGKLVLTLRERRMPGSLGDILCRTRYIDDVLVNSLQSGIEQVVILGAGFDSRAYRIPGIDQVKVIEVDLPGTVKLKRSRIERVLGQVPSNVSLVGMDFDRQNLEQEMEAAGFLRGKKTLFIWEGVTQYINAEAVHETLTYVSKVSGEGSGIVFTYVQRGIIDGTDRPEWMESFLGFAERIGSPLKFGLDRTELPQYLLDHGLRLVSDVGAQDYQEMYLKPIQRKLNVFEGERAVYAEVI